MLNRFSPLVGLLAVALLLTGPARAQSPSSDVSAAARELITTMNLPEQYKAIMPMIMKTLKPAIAQGRSDVERDYDAMIPTLLEGFNSHVTELLNSLAGIYAANFSADELRAMNAFYKTPAGQKFLQKLPAVTQQTMVAGQQFAQSMAADMKKRMIEELRKKGHPL